MGEVDEIQRIAAGWSDYSEAARGGQKELLQRILSAATSSAEAQAELGTNEVVTFITKCLDTADNDDELIELALAAWIAYNRREILNKSTMNLNNCERSESKILSITDTIRHRLRTPTIAMRCAALTMILASDSPDRQAKLGLVGFGVHMCTILRSPHASHDDVAIMAYRAIRNLAIDDNNCMQIVKKGQIMDIFIPHFRGGAEGTLSDEVLDAALYAVINLSNDAEISEALGEAGLVTLLSSVFPRIVHDNDLSNAMCCALRNLFSVGGNLARLVGDSTVADCLVSVHEKHRDDSSTMEAATWCLANMASNAFFRRFLTSTIHLMPILRATFEYGLYTYPDDSTLGPVAEAIVFTIYFLAFHHVDSSSKDSDTASSASALATADSTVERETKEQLVEVGRIAAQLVSEGAVFVLHACMTRYATREAMMEACFRALLSLINKEHPQRETVLKALATMNPVLLLLQAMSHHVAVFDTMYLGLATLSSLLEQISPAGDSPSVSVTIFQSNLIAEKETVTALLSQTLGHHLGEKSLCALVYTLAVAAAVADTTSEEAEQKHEQQRRMQLLVDAGILSLNPAQREISIIRDLTISEGEEAEKLEERDVLLSLVCDVLELDAEVVRSISATVAADQAAQRAQQGLGGYDSEEMQRMFEALIRQQLAAGAGQEINGEEGDNSLPLVPPSNDSA
jgi:hypothetical protein